MNRSGLLALHQSGQSRPRAATCLLACLLAWCAALHAQDPVRTTNAAGETALQVDLPTVMRLAGAQNLEVKIISGQLEKARATYESDQWRFYPWVGAGIGYRRHDDLIQNVEGRILNVHKDQYALGPTVQMQLDLGDAVYTRLASRQRLEAAARAVESRRLLAVKEAAQAYYELTLAGVAIGIQDDAIRIGTEYLQEVEQARAIGLAARADALRVEVELQRLKIAARKAREQRRIAAGQLARELHLEPGVDLVSREEMLIPAVNLDKMEALDSLITRALAQRPEILEAQAQTRARKHNLQGATDGGWIPSVGAQLSAGGLGGGPRGGPGAFGPSEDLGVTLGWRFGQGGLFDAPRIRKSRTEFQTAEWELERVRESIKLQVVEGTTRFQSSRDQFELAKKGVELARESLELNRARKQYGVGAVLEVIQAEQDLTRTRLDYARITTELNKAYIGLKHATGELAAGGK